MRREVALELEKGITQLNIEAGIDREKLIKAISKAKDEYRRILAISNISNDEALEIECSAAKKRLNKLIIEAKQEGLRSRGVEIVGYSRRY